MRLKYERNNKTEFLRWILFVPSSFTGGILIHSFILMLNWIATHLNVYPESFFSTLLARCIGNIGLGFSMVIIACIIAPFHKRKISILMGGILVVVSALLFIASILKSNYRGMFASFSILLGAVSSAYFFYKRESRLFKINHYVGK